MYFIKYAYPVNTEFFLSVIPACPESFFVSGRIPGLPAGRQARFTCGNDNVLYKPNKHIIK